MSPDEIDELLREALGDPRWYALTRLPGGSYQRIPAKPDLHWTELGNDDADTVQVRVTVSQRTDQLLAGLLTPPILGVYHPVYHPDPEYRGESACEAEKTEEHEL